MTEKGNVSLILFYRIPRNQTEELMSTVRETFPNRERKEIPGGRNLPDHLPERLTIAMPIWALHDTPEGGAYHDLDTMMRELVERGFNTIRFDDGAGLIDVSPDGSVRGTIPIVEPFPGFTRNIRQSWCCGDGGPCDLAGRLFELCEAAARHGIFLILSSWYYLHTYQYCGDEARNRRLHAIPAHERYEYFATQLNLLLAELRRRGVIRQIAFAEIFNESDGLNFINGYGNANHLSPEERHRFREEHAQALRRLIQQNPDVLFAVDTYTPYTDPELFPDNPPIWNFHNYFLWDLYRVLERNLLVPGTDVTSPEERGDLDRFLLPHTVPLESIRNTRRGLLPAPEDWYRRIWLYAQLDQKNFPELSQRFRNALRQSAAQYREKLDVSIRHAMEFHRQHCPDALLVCGEGLSFCARTQLQWEEESEEYWAMAEYFVRANRRAGLWGTVLRSCCGPEDPSWHRCPEQLLRLNRIFKGEL